MRDDLRCPASYSAVPFDGPGAAAAAAIREDRRREDRNAPPLQFELFVEDAFFKVVFRIEQQGHRLLA